MNTNNKSSGWFDRLIEWSAEKESRYYALMACLLSVVVIAMISAGWFFASLTATTCNFLK